ncbi:MULTISPECIES: DivIVA domain-containing protein [Exiguobacterium]|jgi:cell division initiation protein|uniref:Septum formation initiator n=2 Tax=Exiguobacterium TaxID=33986 RepID=U1LW24_9BACL|nr:MULTISPECIES: DivIVA domain-containing protein [Exiguobacterium]ERG66427.1 septum formation initiator [Exiguobacterium chiriqhucha RW-2]KAB2864445.1 MAG: DivIVA domain-containing protein [Exiguobacterium chiriqhucha]KGI85068.1 septum formation initiator [Exiguobacterium mexicanum]MCT4776307.1 DivIVA domain-containing protein [Exiguobacterium aquaticum]MCT4789024.1 DivIVA domain-containing protein [Exiguobacterium mexicanum]
MALTPIDIHNKEFSTRFRGYDIDEVNEFLDQIIKEFELLIRENRRYEELVNDMQARIDYFSSMEDTLNKSIIVAQEAAEEVKTNAAKEASLILKQAEREALAREEEASRKEQLAEREVIQMLKKVELYRTRFRVLVDAQMELLNSTEWDTIVGEPPVQTVLDDTTELAYNDDEVIPTKHHG